MARLCPHCGAESSDEEVCSQCGKPLTESQEPEWEVESAGVPQKPTSQAPPPTPPVPPARRGRDEGAAKALVAAEAARRAIPKWPYYLGAVAVVVLLIVVASAIAVKLATKPPEQSEQWQRVSTETKELSLQIPAGWDFATMGSSGTFEKAWVKSGKLYRVSIEGTLAMGAMGDISGAAARSLSTNGAAAVALAQRPEGKLHLWLGEMVEDSDPYYEEQGEMQACTFAGKPAAYSTYTTVKRIGVFSVELKGWRITAPGIGDYSYNIRAQCPAQHWDKFEPIATGILSSITRGGQ